MRFKDFVKKHFPLNHPTAVRPKVKQKRRRTVSGFSRGDRISYSGLFEDTLGEVIRTYGNRIYFRPDSYPDYIWYATPEEVRPA